MNIPSSGSGEASLASTNDFHPSDPYNSYLLQFSGLQSLGYPVVIRPVTRYELPDFYTDVDPNYGYEPHNWEYEHYSSWFGRYVLDTDFSDFIECPDVLGDWPSGDEEFDEQRYKHPMRLVNEIDNLKVGQLTAASRAIRNGDDTTWFAHSNPDFDLAGIVGRAVVTVVERRAQLCNQGYPFSNYQDCTDEDLAHYARLKLEGAQPLNPEQLGGLVVDYYSMVEAHVPDFAAFKR